MSSAKFGHLIQVLEELSAAHTHHGVGFASSEPCCQHSAPEDSASQEQDARLNREQGVKPSARPIPLGRLISSSRHPEESASDPAQMDRGGSPGRGKSKHPLARSLGRH